MYCAVCCIALYCCIAVLRCIALYCCIAYNRRVTVRRRCIAQYSRFLCCIAVLWAVLGLRCIGGVAGGWRSMAERGGMAARCGLGRCRCCDAAAGPRDLRAAAGAALGALMNEFARGNRRRNLMHTWLTWTIGRVPCCRLVWQTSREAAAASSAGRQMGACWRCSRCSHLGLSSALRGPPQASRSGRAPSLPRRHLNTKATAASVLYTLVAESIYLHLVGGICTLCVSYVVLWAVWVLCCIAAVWFNTATSPCHAPLVLHTAIQQYSKYSNTAQYSIQHNTIPLRSRRCASEGKRTGIWRGVREKPARI